MAIHTELNIYKTAFELLCVTMAISRNLPRDLRMLMGKKITEECLEVSTLIQRANMSRNKAPLLIDVVERIGAITLLLRMGWQSKVIKDGPFSRAISLTEKVGRQANAWRKSSAPSPAA